jgi:hypothetical protein
MTLSAAGRQGPARGPCGRCRRCGWWWEGSAFSRALGLEAFRYRRSCALASFWTSPRRLSSRARPRRTRSLAAKMLLPAGECYTPPRVLGFRVRFPFYHFWPRTVYDNGVGGCSGGVFREEDSRESTRSVTAPRVFSSVTLKRTGPGVNITVAFLSVVRWIRRAWESMLNAFQHALSSEREREREQSLLLDCCGGMLFRQACCIFRTECSNISALALASSESLFPSEQSVFSSWRVLQCSQAGSAWPNHDDALQPHVSRVEKMQRVEGLGLRVEGAGCRV